MNSEAKRGIGDEFPGGRAQIQEWANGFDNLSLIALSSNLEKIKAERGISERVVAWPRRRFALKS